MNTAQPQRQHRRVEVRRRSSAMAMNERFSSTGVKAGIAKRLQVC